MVFGDGQSNSVIRIYPGLAGCHGNEIWDTMGYNPAFARDICEIFASIGGFWGLGHQILPIKFYPDRLLLPWQWNLRHKGYNSDSVIDISKIFASNGKFWGGAIEWCQSISATTDPCCHLNVTWPQMVKIVIVKYLWPDISVTDQL